MLRSKTTTIILILAISGAAYLVVAQESRTRPGPPTQPVDDSPMTPSWQIAEQRNLPPGQPGKDYTPVVTPGGSTLPYRVIDGVKVFHLVGSPIKHEMAPGLVTNAWGFNGSTPGPTMEICEGDRVRVYVTNKLPTKLSIHWHGVIVPNGQDGIVGLTQPGIEIGQTFVYEFTFPESGTFMYHPHFDSMTTEGMGMTGMIVVHDRQPPEQRPDRDFAIMLAEFRVDVGVSTIIPFEMTDFNILTMNGRVMPGHVPLVAKLGERVRIRFGNLSPQDHHPIHLHGYSFRIVGNDGGWIKPEAQIPETTVLVHVGSAQVIEFTADNPGDWLMHCHMTHHMMNQMGHDIPNMIGVDTRGLDERISKLIPGYMSMGTTGMGQMAEMNMPVPANSIPMKGPRWQFGKSTMGGMATVLKVRDNLRSYDDPGDYVFPSGSVARPATAQEMQADNIIPATRPSQQTNGHH